MANGIYSCRRTFLDERKWKDVPRQKDPRNKTSFDYFVGLLSDVPKFLQQVTQDAWPSPNPAAGARPDQAIVQNELLDHFRTLKILQVMWHLKYATQVWELPPKTTQSAITSSSKSTSLIDSPFPTVLYFKNMHRAHDYCIYTSTLILLTMLYGHVAHEVEPSLAFSSAGLRELFPEITIRSLVQEICRCTEFMLLNTHGSRGYIILMFPATIAYFASDKDSSEAKYLYSVCKQHVSGSGFGFADLALDSLTPLSARMDRYKQNQRRRQTEPDRAAKSTKSL